MYADRSSLTFKRKVRLSFESVGLLFEGATTNHFLSVVCAENTVGMRKMNCYFRYRVNSKFSTNNTMQMKGRLSFDCGKLSFEGNDNSLVITPQLLSFMYS